MGDKALRDRLRHQAPSHLIQFHQYQVVSRYLQLLEDLV
jgi:hypothetical protein